MGEQHPKRAPLYERWGEREPFFWTVIKWAQLVVAVAFDVYLNTCLASGKDPLLPGCYRSSARTPRLRRESHSEPWRPASAGYSQSPRHHSQASRRSPSLRTLERTRHPNQLLALKAHQGGCHRHRLDPCLDKPSCAYGSDL